MGHVSRVRSGVDAGEVSLSWWFADWLRQYIPEPQLWDLLRQMNDEDLRHLETFLNRVVPDRSFVRRKILIDKEVEIIDGRADAYLRQWLSADELWALLASLSDDRLRQFDRWLTTQPLPPEYPMPWAQTPYRRG